MKAKHEPHSLYMRKSIRVLLILMLLFIMAYSVQGTSAMPLLALQTENINVALDKTATQSSTFSDNFCTGAAQNAVDGNANGAWANSNCSVTHTLNDDQAWWQVDLDALYHISTIEIWNRTDSDPERLSNFDVWGKPDNNENTSWQLLYYFPGMAGVTETLTINAPVRILKIQLRDTNFLSLAEVKVFATDEIVADSDTVLLDHFNDNTAGTAVGTLNYQPSLSGLNQAGVFAPGNFVRYALAGWYNGNGSDSSTQGTVEMWVKPTSPGSFLNFNWGNSDTVPSNGHVLYGFGILPGSDGIEYNTWNSERCCLPSSLTGNIPIPNDQWTHLAVSWSPTASKLYVNGQVVASANQNIYPELSNPIYVYLNDWGTGAFAGLIDELHISKVQRSDAVIQSHANLSSTPTPTTTGSISGTVYETDGVTPLSNIYVAVNGGDFFAGGYFAGACTDSSGNYAFSELPFGTALQVNVAPPWTNCGQWSNYVQEFWQETQNSGNASSVILDALNPDRADINFTLDAGGVISGTAYAADGVTPLEHIAISFQGDNNYGNAVCTDANGHYEFHGAPFGMPLRVRADAYWDAWCNAGADYVSEFWQETPNSDSASLLTVTSLAPSQAGIDFTLDVGGTISGTVYQADGTTPISNMVVSLNGDYYGSGTCTDNMGHYIVHGVPFGLALRARAAPDGNNWCGGPNNYVTESWQEASNSNNFTPLTVTALSPSQTGIDFTLDVGGTISGTVYQADGVTPISNMIVSFHGDGYGSGVCTDTAGNYVFHAAPFGLQLQVRAGSGGDNWCGGPNNYLTELWQETPSSENATTLTVTTQAADISGINFTLDIASAPNPHLDVWYMDGNVNAYDWPLGTHLILIIEDTTTTQSPDYSAETDVVGFTSWNVNTTVGSFNLNGQFEIIPGMIVTVSGASMSKELVVSNLSVTSIDLVNDTVSGSTEPNQEMWMWFESSCCRGFQANSSGIWSVDYRQIGPNDEPAADIGPSSSGTINAVDNDGDNTSLNWNAPNYTLHVNPKDHEVHGHAWPAGSTITLTIDDDTNHGNGTLYEETKAVEADTTCGIPCFNLSGIFDLEIGQYVSMTDGTVTNTVHVSTLAVTSMDIDQDTITGIADPNSSVSVDFHSSVDAVGQIVVTDGSGNWTADFTGIYDLTIDDYGRAIQLNPDGSDDGTLEYWNASPPIVTSSIRANTNPTAAASVDFTVTFSESVTGVDATDFSLTTTGVSGAAVSGVGGSGSVYTVTVNTGGANGTIRLNVVDNDTIVDSTSTPLGNDFNVGEVYTVNKGNSAPPSRPTLASPGNSILTTDYTPLLDWNNSTIPVGTIFDYYQLQIATDSAFTSTILDVNIGGISNSSFTPLNDLASNTKFYWRVRAFNAYGNASAWSAVRNFDTALLPPTLVTPNSAEQMLVNRPTFEWDDVSGAADYRIQISNNAGFTSTLTNAVVTPSTYTRTSDLPFGVTLYWRVRSNGTNGPSAWSEVRSLITTNPPSVPTLAAPGNNAKESGSSLLFNWNDSTLPVGVDFDRYQIQIATDNSFTVIVHDNNVAGITNSQDNTAVLSPATTYYWRVRAFNTLGHASAWSSVRHVRIIFAGPILTQPTTGSTVSSLIPTFTWDAVSGATDYTIQVSKNSTFSPLVINKTATSPTYTHTANLQAGTTYYWRVRVKSPTTYGPGDWSDVFTFTTP